MFNAPCESTRIFRFEGHRVISRRLVAVPNPDGEAGAGGSDERREHTTPLPNVVVSGGTTTPLPALATHTPLGAALIQVYGTLKAHAEVGLHVPHIIAASLVELCETALGVGDDAA